MLLVAAATALVSAAPAFAARHATGVSGVVIARQHGTVLVAGARGAVRAAHGRFTVGTRVATRSGRLVAVGTSRHAVIRGTVVRSRGSVTFISAGGHLVAVRHGRTLASASDSSPSQPTPGTVVQTTVGIDDQGDLDEDQQDDVGTTQQTQIQATVSAVGPGTITVTVNGQALTLNLPAGLTLPSSVVGTQVTLTLTFSNGDVTASSDDSSDDNGATASGSGDDSGSGASGDDDSGDDGNG